LARLALNFKKLPFETVFIEYRDIEAKANELGVAPTGRRPDGTPRYTLPMIYDASTKTAVADSTNIVEYLDSAYPYTPQFLAPKTKGIVKAFGDSVSTGTTWAVPLTMPHAFETRQLTFASIMHIVKHNPGIENIMEPYGVQKERHWIQGELEMERLASYFESDTTFMTGEEPTAGDFCIAGALISLRALFGKDSQGWTRMMTWQDGKWKRFMDALAPYEKV
jgi:glutathione S-transferase